MVDSKLMRLTKTVAQGQMEDWNKEPTLPGKVKTKSKIKLT